MGLESQESLDMLFKKYWHPTTLNLLCWPVVDHGHHLASVIGSEVHSSWASEKATVPLTNQSNSWSVDDWSKMFDVFDENLFKATHIRRFKSSF